MALTPRRDRASREVDAQITAAKDAATAFLLGRTQDENRGAVSYLQSVLDHAGGTTAPVPHPRETFELLWAAYQVVGGTGD